MVAINSSFTHFLRIVYNDYPYVQYPCMKLIIEEHFSPIMDKNEVY